MNSRSLAERMIEEFIESPDGIHPDDHDNAMGRTLRRRRPRIKGDQSPHHPSASMTAQDPPKDWISFSGATQGVG